MNNSATAIVLTAIIFLALVLNPLHVYSLGQTGHRVTGAIAERHLKPHTKKAIKAILGNESLAEASTYADDMRANPSEFWQKIASPYHYVTVPPGKHYHQVGAPPQGDSLVALEKFSNMLKSSKTSKEDKALALRFIVHIIGDLHQPLHVGNGKDRGGNEFIVSFFDKVSNLHRVWDTDLIEKENLSYTEWVDWLDKQITKNDIKNWKSNDPIVWIKESGELRDKVYPKQKRIGYDYVYKFTPIIKLRLKQAGIRIAYFFDKLFEKK